MKNYSWSLFSLVWAGLVLYLSFVHPVSVDGGEPWFQNQDKLAHFVFYAILGGTFIKASAQELKRSSPLMLGGSVAFIFGGLIELGQHFLTTNREGDWVDAFSNGLGVLVIALLIHNYTKLFRYHPKAK